MPLPPQAIEEFRAIWREEYDEDLALAEARFRAEEFLRFVALVVRQPIHLYKGSQRDLLPPVDNPR